MTRDFKVFWGVMLSAAIAIGGTACQSVQQAAQTHPVASACAVVGGSLQTLAIGVEAKKVPAALLTSIPQLLAITNPVCTAKTEPTLSDAESIAFQAAVAQLATMAATVQGNTQ